MAKSQPLTGKQVMSDSSRNSGIRGASVILSQNRRNLGPYGKSIQQESVHRFWFPVSGSGPEQPCPNQNKSVSLPTAAAPQKNAKSVFPCCKVRILA